MSDRLAGKLRGAILLPRLRYLAGAALMAIFLLAPSPAPAQATLPADQNAPSLPIYPQSTADFDQMRQTRLVRILVPYSKTIYFVDKGAERGVAAEAFREFETWLNKKYKTKSRRIQIAFVPMARDQLLAALNDGRGDIVAANLTITPERAQIVAFSTPVMTSVNEVLVTGPAAPQIKSLDDLAGREIYVRRSSSYYTHLLALNAEFKRRNLPEIVLIAADENLEDEDLLEMVNAGLLHYAVVDDSKARIWSKIFDHLVVRNDLAVNTGGEVAWAIRQTNPLLLAEVNDFIKAYDPKKSAFAAEVKRKYYGSTKIIKNAYSPQERADYDRLIQFFKKYGDQYSFDYLMLAAQGFQESRLKQSARSHMGAVGVMQMLPSTAADPTIGIRGIDASAEKNILAGTKYLRFLVDTYLNDPAIDQTNRTLMAFAAYNAGPGNLARFRKWAAKSELNPNLWFYNVEEGAARIVGQETVTYVANIYKYYIAYHLLTERMAAASNAVDPGP